MPVNAAVTIPKGQFGLPDSYAPQYEVMEAAAAITARQLVVVQFDTTNGWRVNTTTTASHRRAFGVADQDIASGGWGLIIVEGVTLVNVGANTPADQDVCITSTTAGVAGSATPDATTVVGSVVGVYAGAKDASNLAPVIVGKM